MSARDRIALLPRDGSTLARWRWAEAVANLAARSPTWEPLALISCGGTLVRHRTTGRLMEHHGTHLAAVHERKALTALAALER